MELPEGVFFKDKEGIHRSNIRVRWWKLEEGYAIADLVMPEPIEKSLGDLTPRDAAQPAQLCWARAARVLRALLAARPLGAGTDGPEHREPRFQRRLREQPAHGLPLERRTRTDSLELCHRHCLTHMSTHTEPTAVCNDNTRKARSMMDQLRALRDAATDPEVIEEISDEMNCVALSWQVRELFDEDAAAAEQTLTVRRVPSV